jgi:hypothetical protein
MSAQENDPSSTKYSYHLTLIKGLLIANIVTMFENVIGPN